LITFNFTEIHLDKKNKKKKQVQDFELKKSIPRKVESLSTNRISVGSKSLKSSTTPMDVSLGLKSFSTKSLNPVIPSLTGSKSNALLNDRSINVVHKKLDSISAKEIPLEHSFTGTTLPLESSTVESLASRYKTIFSSAALNTDYRLKSKNVERHEDHSLSKNIKSKSVIQSRTDHTKCLGKKDFSLKTYFDNKNSRPPLHNYVRRSSSCDDEMENIKVVKHVHRNVVCVKGPEFITKDKGLSPIAELTEGGFKKYEHKFKYFQETKQLDDDLTTNTDSSSSLQV